MEVYIFLRSPVSEVPAAEKLPTTIHANSDGDAVKQAENLGPGELFKKIPRVPEKKTLKKAD